VEQESPRRVDVDWVAPIVTGYVRHNKIAPDQLAGIVGEVHRALPVLRVPHWRKSRRDRRCGSVARSSRIMWFVSRAGFARRRSAHICGSGTASESAITAPAGNCQ